MLLAQIILAVAPGLPLLRDQITGEEHSGHLYRLDF